MEGTAKKRGENDVKWARNGLKKVGSMTDSWETHGSSFFLAQKLFETRASFASLR